MFTRISGPAALVTLDSFLRISFRTTFNPPHLRFSATLSCARRPDMSHNEAGSNATAHRPKKLICTSDISTRPLSMTHIRWLHAPPRGTSSTATKHTELQANSNSTSQSPPETLKLEPRLQAALLPQHKHLPQSHPASSKPKLSAPKPRLPAPRPKARSYPMRHEHTNS